jgi:serine/threonine protein kinase
MQLVRGESLFAMLKRGRLPFGDIERIVNDIATGLQHAHDNDIIHRDVKPHNILLETATKRALLADFGIATAVRGEADLTGSGGALGTPAYMSPEQIDGRRVDRRSDIYSLGIVAWEMIAGRRAWEGDNLYKILYKQRNEHLPALTELRPTTPARFELAIEGALAKNPAHRWATVSEFLAQLETDDATPRLLELRQIREAALAPPTDPDSTAKVDRNTLDALAQGKPASGDPRTPERTARLQTYVRRGLRSTALLMVGLTVGVLLMRSNRSQGSPANPPAESLEEPTVPITTPSTTSAAPSPPPASGTNSRGDGEAPPVAASSSEPLKVTVLDIGRAFARRPESARRLVETAIARSPKDGAVYVAAARYNLLEGDLRSAWANAEIAERLGQHWSAQVLCAMLEAKEGRPTLSRRRLEALLRAQPLRSVLPAERGVLLATAYLALSDVTAARAVLKRVAAGGRDELRRALADPSLASLQKSS